MLENELKQNIAHNITALRKKNNMTQAELAEQLNYSDKSISKWERGDGLPDVFVLVKIAEMFGVTVNDIVSLNSPDEIEQLPIRDTTHPRRVLITALSSGLVWFIAMVVFFLLSVFLPDAKGLWLSFICAVPVCAIVWIVFTHLWWGRVARCLSVSTLIWGMTVMTHLIISLAGDVRNMSLIYAATGVFQVLVIMWYLYSYLRKKYRRTVEAQAAVEAAEDDSREISQQE